MGQGRASSGTPTASVRLDLTQLQTAPAQAQAIGQGVSKGLDVIGAAAVKAQGTVASLSGVMTQAQGPVAAFLATTVQGSAALSGMGASAAQAQVGIAKIGAAAQGTSAQLNAAIAAAAKLSNTKYLIANAPAPVFAAQGGGGGLLASLGGAGGIARGVAGGLGIGLGVAGATQAAKSAVEGTIAATKLAVAYNRQELAARNLAGSQGKLNELLAAYDIASGGAVDKATALANVTRLQAVGFAHNAAELTRFVQATRGAAIAMGKPQEDIGQEVQLAISNQSMRRLDQIGLGVQEVTNRISELRAANSGMTREAAFQEAVLGLLDQKYGKLGKSALGAATGIEKAGKAATDAKLAFGELVSRPLNLAADIVAARIQRETDLLRGEIQAYDDLWRAAQRAFGVQVTTGFQQRFIASSASRDAGRHSGGGPGINPHADEIHAVKMDWAKGVQDVNAQMHADIIDEETSFGASRAKTVADYNKSVARDEASYARGRLRANLDFLDSLADVAKDATRREAGQAADLARTMSSARADSAEHEADARKDAAKQLRKLDENYEKERVKAAKDLSDKLLDAAGNLDAKQVYELQRDGAKQAKEAADAHTDARKEIGDGLKERLDDEAKSLAKSLKQQQESYDRQLTEGRENDRLRLEDMKAAFAKQQDRQKQDHDDQVTQRAEDQAAQLTEMDTQHGLRMTQIAVHAAAERGALDEQAKIDLLALGVRNDAWKKVQDAKELAQEKLWDKLMEHIGLTLQGPKVGPKEPAATFPTILHPPSFASGGYVPSTGLAFLHRGEYVMPARAVASMTTHSNNSRAINIHPGAVVIHAAPGMDEDRLVSLAIDGLIDRLEAA